MLNKIKKTFPGLYNYYRCLKRKKKIYRAKMLKRMPFDQKVRKLEKLYLERVGHSLDWNNLCTYTEKMQWVKLYDDNPQKVILSDKYSVREWVTDKIGGEYLIPLLGCWDSFDEIDFLTLPSQFVLKTNHGSGTNFIVKDKTKLNLKELKSLAEDWMKMDFAYNNGFELHYSKIKPKIIIEKYMENNNGELQDYKFLCFNGKPYYYWVDLGRFSKHTRNVYDLDWNLQPWNQWTYGISIEKIPKPKNYDEMIRIATLLCNGFSHVRVDLYNVDGKIYFGEMTFTNGGGFEKIIPEKYDRMLGNLWHLDMHYP